MNLPDSSSGFVVEDIDWVVRQYDPITNKEQSIMILEEKCNMSKVSHGQRKTLGVINKALAIGLKEMGIEFKGTHLVQWKTYSPYDGLYFDNEEISEQDLINRLTQ